MMLTGFGLRFCPRSTVHIFNRGEGLNTCECAADPITPTRVYQCSKYTIQQPHAYPLYLCISVFLTRDEPGQN